jgi:hypothetical protein
MIQWNGIEEQYDVPLTSSLTNARGEREREREGRTRHTELRQLINNQQNFLVVGVILVVVVVEVVVVISGGTSLSLFCCAVSRPALKLSFSIVDDVSLL